MEREKGLVDGVWMDGQIDKQPVMLFLVGVCIAWAWVGEDMMLSWQRFFPSAKLCIYEYVLHEYEAEQGVTPRA